MLAFIFDTCLLEIDWSAVESQYYFKKMANWIALNSMLKLRKSCQIVLGTCRWRRWCLLHLLCRVLFSWKMLRNYNDGLIKILLVRQGLFRIFLIGSPACSGGSFSKSGKVGLTSSFLCDCSLWKDRQRDWWWPKIERSVVSGWCGPYWYERLSTGFPTNCWAQWCTVPAAFLQTLLNYSQT